MPFAARQGDITLHGGLISSGASSVLIEGKPAARVGDAHLCPMFNPGPSPHVGGPVLDGTGSVLIEGQVAATQGSSCQCCAAVDSISVGAGSVVIGSASVLSSGGQLCVSDLQQRRQQARQAEIASYRSHFLQLQFYDASGNPLLPMAYRLECRNEGESGVAKPGLSKPGLSKSGLSKQRASNQGQWESGVLDSEGRLSRFYLARAGQYRVSLLAVQALSWSVSSCALGDQVKLKVTFSDQDQTGEFQLDVYGQSRSGQAQHLQRLRASCEHGVIEQAWQAQIPPTLKLPISGFFFTLEFAGQSLRSDTLPLKHPLEMELHQLAPLNAMPITVYFADAGIIHSAFDGGGYCFIDAPSAGIYRFEYRSHQVMYPE